MKTLVKPSKDFAMKNKLIAHDLSKRFRLSFAFPSTISDTEFYATYRTNCCIFAIAKIKENKFIHHYRKRTFEK